MAEAGAEDVDRAVHAATRAFQDSAWSQMIPAAREALLLRWADLVERHGDELAELESLDNGKLVLYARMVDVPATVNLIRYYAGWATKIQGVTTNVSIGMPNTYLKKTMFLTFGTSTPVVRRSTVVAMR